MKDIQEAVVQAPEEEPEVQVEQPAQPVAQPVEQTQATPEVQAVTQPATAKHWVHLKLVFMIPGVLGSSMGYDGVALI